MFRINIDPVLVHLGPVAISWYGLAVMAALAAGMWLTLREARRRQLPASLFSDIAIWVVLGGIVGARLLHVLDHWHYYAAEPMRSWPCTTAVLRSWARFWAAAWPAPSLPGGRDSRCSRASTWSRPAWCWDRRSAGWGVW